MLTLLTIALTFLQIPVLYKQERIVKKCKRFSWDRR